jgi:hypothetical protein
MIIPPMLSENTPVAPKSKSRWLTQSRRWHKWGGVAAGLFLLVAATSGIILNYKRPIFAALGVELNARELRTSDGRSRSPKSQDNYTATPTTVDGLSKVAISLEQALALACESWGDVPVERIELRADRSGLLYRIKARSGEELQVNATTGTHFVKGEYEKVKATADGKVAARTMDWGRIILDLHTGKIGGEVGKAVMSFAAFLLLWLTLSGVYLWLKPLLIRRKSARNKLALERTGKADGPAPAQPRKLA